MNLCELICEALVLFRELSDDATIFGFVLSANLAVQFQFITHTAQVRLQLVDLVFVFDFDGIELFAYGILLLFEQLIREKTLLIRAPQLRSEYVTLANEEPNCRAPKIYSTRLCSNQRGSQVATVPLSDIIAERERQSVNRLKGWWLGLHSTQQVAPMTTLTVTHPPFLYN